MAAAARISSLEEILVRRKVVDGGPSYRDIYVFPVDDEGHAKFHSTLLSAIKL